MADNLKKRGKPDRSRINMKEKWEFHDWKKTLGVSGQALAGAVRAVGPMVKDVKKYLSAKA